MMKYYILLAVAVWFIGCSGPDTAPQAGLENNAAHAPAGVEISQARVRPPLPGQNIAAGYFTLTSEKGDRLLAVTSPASPRVEIHQHTENDAGVLRMRKINGGVVIPAGGQVEFKPGHYHAMIFDVNISDQSEDLALTFDFETAEDVTIIAEIMRGPSYGSGASPDAPKTDETQDKKSYGSGH